MSYPSLIRLGAIGFGLGSVVWILFRLAAVGQEPGALPSGFALVFYILAILLTVMGLAGLHTSHKDDHGRVGQVGFYIVLVSSAAAILGSVADLLGGAALEWVIFAGILGAIVGFALYGVATLRAKVLPRWYGVVLLVLGVYGVLWVGLVQLALGIALWTRTSTAAEQPPRVN